MVVDIARDIKALHYDTHRKSFSRDPDAAAGGKRQDSVVMFGDEEVMATAKKCRLGSVPPAERDYSNGGTRRDTETVSLMYYYIIFIYINLRCCHITMFYS